MSLTETLLMFLVFLMFLGGLGATSLHAAAHLGHVVQRAERFIKVDVAGSKVRLVVSLTLGPDEMVQVLRKADTDSDRRVSQTEADQYMMLWAKGLASELPVAANGARVDVVWGDAFLEPIGAVRPQAGSAELVGRFVLYDAETQLVIQDVMRQQTFERTDVVFTARNHAQLVRAGPGTQTNALQPRFHFGPGQSPGAFSARLNTPAAPRPMALQPCQCQWFTAPAVGGGLGLIVLLGLGLVIVIVLRRRR